MTQERSAKLVVRGQGIRQPAHEGGAPHPGGLDVGSMALSAVHAGRAGGDAPFDNWHFVSLNRSERVTQERLGLRQAPFLQGDLRKQPGGGRTEWRISRRSGQVVQRLRLAVRAVELAARQPELAEPAAQEDLPGPRHRLDASRRHQLRRRERRVRLVELAEAKVCKRQLEHRPLAAGLRERRAPQLLTRNRCRAGEVERFGV